MSTQELTATSKAVVQAYMDTLTTGDIDALRGFFTAESTWTLAGDLPLSGTWTGPVEILEEFVPQMVARLRPETMEFSFDGLIAEGEKVLAEWNTLAQARTGGRYDQHCLAVFTIRDGKIASVREYFDTLHAKTVVFAESDPTTVVLRYFEALAAGDQDVICDSWALDGSCWYGGDLPISGTWQGRDQVINGFLATAFAHLDPEKEIGIKVTNHFGAGEQVLVEWDSWATGKTGRPYRENNIGVFTVRDGKITNMREYADTQHWQRALVA
ncbi:nuclear transport factor 2 family protein [Streptomyces sp. NBC_00448]|uniref:nuclear transport factor 2 family protein n=1 Tax=Streptomyces sp. NBC_00448 TaxID=2903652 RepID=UPI002E23EF68